MITYVVGGAIGYEDGMEFEVAVFQEWWQQ